jgi:sugar phosphate isomerase/epimerase
MMTNTVPTDAKKSREPLERTSVQLPRQTIELLDSWPGLNRSEALRLTVDRYHYLEAIAARGAEQLVEKYRPAFHLALAELTFRDYKVVARSLRAVVMGALAEEDLRDTVERERRTLGESQIDWQQFETELAALDQLGRIRVLDYVTGQRHNDSD